MTTRIANRKVCVELDGRTFFVGLAPDGSPVNILERRLVKRGRKPYWSANTYWHRRDPIPKDGRGKRWLTGRSIVREVLEKARVDTRHFNGH